MLKSKHKWLVEQNDEQNETIDLPISSTIKRMLHKRGINTTEEAKQFLYPTLDDLHDPFLFPDMEKAVHRIKEAIKHNEKILIYGDYDADGVTSTALLMNVLTQLNANVYFYIPHRLEEGYGPNEETFLQACDNDFSLIITVDNGISGIKEAQLLKERQVDLIITDHHEVQEQIPDAYAIIHPLLADAYPFKQLAGVGVAFKLAQALLGDIKEELLELVAIGTVADLVPLVDENRILVKKGIEQLNQSQSKGITAIKQIAKADHVTEETIGFVFGPRLNAVGRLQDASLAVDLLLENDEEIAFSYAEEIERLNEERQNLVTTIAEEAFKEIEAYYKGDSFFVLAKENWHPGVLGIVASRIVNKYNRPTFMLSINSETKEAKGSGRSIPSFDLFKHGMALKDLFLQFGGHEQACGMTVSSHSITELRDAFNKRAKETLTEEDFVPKIEVELDLDILDLDLNLPEQINLLAPFGMGNPKPIFKLSDVTIQEIRQIGAKKNHIKMVGLKEDVQFDIVGFHFGDIAKQLALRSNAHLVGEIEINEWNGRKKVQMILKDLSSDEVQIFDYRGVKNKQHLKDLIVKEQTIIVGFNGQNDFSEWQIPVINFSDVTANILEDYHHLVLFDLPNQLEDLSNLLSMKRFNSIYVCFQTEDDHYFDKLPTRDEFINLYKTLAKHKIINERDKKMLADAKRWTIDQLNFMLNVFLDLKFVTIKNGQIVFQKNVKQQSLSTSKTYKQKMNAVQVEKTLYYSSYGQLKEWMLTHIDVPKLKGEVVHGL